MNRSLAYSNVSPEQRKKAGDKGLSTALAALSQVPPPSSAQALGQQWARLIKQVHEADPLLCPRCGASMRVIAFIERPEVIEKILTHLGLCPAQAHSPPVGSPLPFSLQRVVAA